MISKYIYSKSTQLLILLTVLGLFGGVVKSSYMGRCSTSADPTTVGQPAKFIMFFDIDGCCRFYVNTCYLEVQSKWRYLFQSGTIQCSTNTGDNRECKKYNNGYRVSYPKWVDSLIFTMNEYKFTNPRSVQTMSFGCNWSGTVQKPSTTYTPTPGVLTDLIIISDPSSGPGLSTYLNISFKPTDNLYENGIIYFELDEAFAHGGVCSVTFFSPTTNLGSFGCEYKGDNKMIYIYDVVAGGATITSTATITFQITDLVNFNDGTERQVKISTRDRNNGYYEANTYLIDTSNGTWAAPIKFNATVIPLLEEASQKTDYTFSLKIEDAVPVNKMVTVTFPQTIRVEMAPPIISDTSCFSSTGSQHATNNTISFLTSGECLGDETFKIKNIYNRVYIGTTLPISIVFYRSNIVDPEQTWQSSKDDNMTITNTISSFNTKIVEHKAGSLEVGEEATYRFTLQGNDYIMKDSVIQISVPSDGLIKLETTCTSNGTAICAKHSTSTLNITGQATRDHYKHNSSAIILDILSGILNPGSTQMPSTEWGIQSTYTDICHSGHVFMSTVTWTPGQLLNTLITSTPSQNLISTAHYLIQFNNKHPILSGFEIVVTFPPEIIPTPVDCQFLAGLDPAFSCTKSLQNIIISGGAPTEIPKNTLIKFKIKNCQNPRFTGIYGGFEVKVENIEDGGTNFIDVKTGIDVAINNPTPYLVGTISLGSNVNYVNTTYNIKLKSGYKHLGEEKVFITPGAEVRGCDSNTLRAVSGIDPPKSVGEVGGSVVYQINSDIAANTEFVIQVTCTNPYSTETTSNFTLQLFEATPRDPIMCAETNITTTTGHPFEHISLQLNETRINEMAKYTFTVSRKAYYTGETISSFELVIPMEVQIAGGVSCTGISGFTGGISCSLSAKTLILDSFAAVGATFSFEVDGLQNPNTHLALTSFHLKSREVAQYILEEDTTNTVPPIAEFIDASLIPSSFLASLQNNYTITMTLTSRAIEASSLITIYFPTGEFILDSFGIESGSSNCFDAASGYSIDASTMGVQTTASGCPAPAILTLNIYDVFNPPYVTTSSPLQIKIYNGTTITNSKLCLQSKNTSMTLTTLLSSFSTADIQLPLASSSEVAEISAYKFTLVPRDYLLSASMFKITIPPQFGFDATCSIDSGSCSILSATEIQVTSQISVPNYFAQNASGVPITFTLTGIINPLSTLTPTTNFIIQSMDATGTILAHQTLTPINSSTLFTPGTLYDLSITSSPDQNLLKTATYQFILKNEHIMQTGFEMIIQFPPEIMLSTTSNIILGTNLDPITTLSVDTSNNIIRLIDPFATSVLPKDSGIEFQVTNIQNSRYQGTYAGFDLNIEDVDQASTDQIDIYNNAQVVLQTCTPYLVGTISLGSNVNYVNTTYNIKLKSGYKHLGEEKVFITPGAEVRGCDSNTLRAVSGIDPPKSVGEVGGSVVYQINSDIAANTEFVIQVTCTNPYSTETTSNFTLQLFEATPRDPIMCAETNITTTTGHPFEHISLQLNETRINEMAKYTFTVSRKAYYTGETISSFELVIPMEVQIAGGVSCTGISGFTGGISCSLSAKTLILDSFAAVGATFSFEVDGLQNPNTHLALTSFHLKSREVAQYILEEDTTNTVPPIAEFIDASLIPSSFLASLQNNYTITMTLTSRAIEASSLITIYFPTGEFILDSFGIESGSSNCFDAASGYSIDASTMGVQTTASGCPAPAILTLNIYDVFNPPYVTTSSPLQIKIYNGTTITNSKLCLQSKNTSMTLTTLLSSFSTADIQLPLASSSEVAEISAYKFTLVPRDYLLSASMFKITIPPQFGFDATCSIDSGSCSILSATEIQVTSQISVPNYFAQNASGVPITFTLTGIINPLSTLTPTTNFIIQSMDATGTILAHQTLTPINSSTLFTPGTLYDLSITSSPDQNLLKTATYQFILKNEHIMQTGFEMIIQFPPEIMLSTTSNIILGTNLDPITTLSVDTSNNIITLFNPFASNPLPYNSLMKFQITNVQNPRSIGTYNGFNISISNIESIGSDFIDIHENGNVIITQFTQYLSTGVTLGNPINNDYSSYIFIFKSEYPHYTGEFMHITLPITRVSSCDLSTLTNNSATDAPLSKSIFGTNTYIYELGSDIVPSKEFSIKLTCLNPLSTQPTDNFLFELFTPLPKLKILEGTSSAATSIGSPFDLFEITLNTSLANIPVSYEISLTRAAPYNTEIITKIEIIIPERIGFNFDNLIVTAGWGTITNVILLSRRRIEVSGFGSNPPSVLTITLDGGLRNPKSGETSTNSFRVLTYESGNWLLEEQNRGLEISVECNFNCKRCKRDSKSSCSSCYEESYGFGEWYLHLPVERCIRLSDCPKYSLIESGNMGNKCTDCHPPCQQCERTVNTCISCLHGYSLQGLQCLSQCDPGYYTLGNICLQCDLLCAHCLHTSSTCTQCHSPKLLFLNSCYHYCPSTTYLYQEFECMPCSDNCLECEGNSDNCRACRSKSNHKAISHEGICIEECPNGYFLPPPPSPIFCLPCDSSCKTCENTYNNCTSCHNSKTLSISHTIPNECRSESNSSIVYYYFIFLKIQAVCIILDLVLKICRCKIFYFNHNLIWQTALIFISANIYGIVLFQIYSTHNPFNLYYLFSIILALLAQLFANIIVIFFFRCYLKQDEKYMYWKRRNSKSNILLFTSMALFSYQISRLTFSNFCGITDCMESTQRVLMLLRIISRILSIIVFLPLFISGIYFLSLAPFEPGIGVIVLEITVISFLFIIVIVLDRSKERQVHSLPIKTMEESSISNETYIEKTNENENVAETDIQFLSKKKIRSNRYKVFSYDIKQLDPKYEVNTGEQRFIKVEGKEVKGVAEGVRGWTGTGRNKEFKELGGNRSQSARAPSNSGISHINRNILRKDELRETQMESQTTLYSGGDPNLSTQVLLVDLNSNYHHDHHDDDPDVDHYDGDGDEWNSDGDLESIVVRDMGMLEHERKHNTFGYDLSQISEYLRSPPKSPQGSKFNPVSREGGDSLEVGSLWGEGDALNEPYLIHSSQTNQEIYIEHEEYEIEGLFDGIEEEDNLDTKNIENDIENDIDNIPNIKDRVQNMESPTPRSPVINDVNELEVGEIEEEYLRSKWNTIREQPINVEEIGTCRGELDSKGMKGTKGKKIISRSRSLKLSRSQIEEHKIRVLFHDSDEDTLSVHSSRIPIVNKQADEVILSEDRNKYIDPERNKYIDPERNKYIIDPIYQKSSWNTVREEDNTNTISPLEDIKYIAKNVFNLETITEQRNHMPIIRRRSLGEVSQLTKDLKLEIDQYNVNALFHTPTHSADDHHTHQNIFGERRIFSSRPISSLKSAFIGEGGFRSAHNRASIGDEESEDVAINYLKSSWNLLAPLDKTMEKPKEYSGKSKEEKCKQKHIISISDLMTNHILEGKKEIRGKFETTLKLKEVEEEKEPNSDTK